MRGVGGLGEEEGGGFPGEAGAEGGGVFGGERELAAGEGVEFGGTAGGAHDAGGGVGGGSEEEVAEFVGDDEGEGLVKGSG